MATKDKPPCLIGDMVLRFREKVAQDLSEKLEDRYNGPYYVHNAYDNSTYELKTPNETILPRRVHGNKLKIYKKPHISFNPLLFQAQKEPSSGLLPQSTNGLTRNIQFKYYKPEYEQES
ncbi:hypothetical protein BD560DRAFT_439868 [Blakeslea trispora]|nr:hypothetical protein BD560DRAFT_439868 [Blakeslea trispora]